MININYQAKFKQEDFRFRPKRRYSSSEPIIESIKVSPGGSVH